MEVKIGVQHAPRELLIESHQSAEEVNSIVTAAIEKGGILALDDDKGRRVVVPVDKLAYVEIGEPEVRRVGFGAM